MNPNRIEASCPLHSRKPCALHPLTSPHASPLPHHLHPPFKQPTCAVGWETVFIAGLKLHRRYRSG